MTEHVDSNPTVSILDDSYSDSVGAHEVDHVGINDTGSVDDNTEVASSKWRNYTTLAILTCINLLNYMDRFTVAALLEDIKSYYGASNTEGGLLQTVFILAYMTLSPVFGWLGDRGKPGSFLSRKWIMLCGILLWSGITFTSSFIPSQYFSVFLIMRCLVGIGEASYSTVSPPVIADLFVGDARTIALIVFNLAVPLGSGLGYIVGSQVAQATGVWQWGLRITPILGIACIILLLFVFVEPVRGQAEQATHLHATSVLEDVRHLARNKSFIFNTLGFTGVSFVAGALSWWSPLFLDKAIQTSDSIPPFPPMPGLGLGVTAAAELKPNPLIALVFGIVTCVAGIVGVTVGAETARRLRSRLPNADPWVCAVGVTLCTPFLYFALLLSRYNLPVTYLLIFFGECMLCLTWALVNDINLKITVPTRRSIATSVNILTCHLLGDAGSPWLVGFISDSYVKSSTDPTAPVTQFLGLQNALFSCCFVALLGGAAFLACTRTYLHDIARVIRIEQASKRFYANEGASYTPPNSDSLVDLPNAGSINVMSRECRDVFS